MFLLKNYLNCVLYIYIYIYIYIYNVLIFNNLFRRCFNFSKVQRKRHETFKNFEKYNKAKRPCVLSKENEYGLTKIRLIGYEKTQVKSTVISQSIEFTNNFSDEKKKTQLQRFSGCLNVSDYNPNIRMIAKPLFNRLRKNSAMIVETDEKY